MSEPTYHYVKGIGWVPSMEDTATAVIGVWRITAVIKKPEIGDNVVYARPEQSAENILSSIKINSEVTCFDSELDTKLLKFNGNAAFEGLVYRPIYLERV